LSITTASKGTSSWKPLRVVRTFLMASRLLRLDHLAEHGIAPALAGGSGVVQEAVVHGVDEELGGGAVRIAGGAMAMVYLSFFRPFLASFSMGAAVSFCFMSAAKPPPWIMKFLITRWKMVPL
jgi:hypothetical protein